MCIHSVEILKLLPQSLLHIETGRTSFTPHTPPIHLLKYSSNFLLLKLGVLSYILGSECIRVRLVFPNHDLPHNRDQSLKSGHGDYYEIQE